MGRTLRRITFTKALSPLALLVCCGVANAQSTPQVFTQDIPVNNQATVNSCSAGEPVTLNGNVHFEYSFTRDGGGVNHFSIKAANALTGVGQNTGAPYAANDSNTYTVNTSDPSAQLNADMQSDLTPQGAGTALTLVQTLQITADVNGNLSAQVLQNATQCAN